LSGKKQILIVEDEADYAKAETYNISAIFRKPYESEQFVSKIRLYIKANWTWAGIGFGLLYWILESIRDTTSN